jgi:hypothetical protein
MHIIAGTEHWCEGFGGGACVLLPPPPPPSVAKWPFSGHIKNCLERLAKATKRCNKATKRGDGALIIHRFIFSTSSFKISTGCRCIIALSLRFSPTFKASSALLKKHTINASLALFFFENHRLTLYRPLPLK